MSSQNRRSLGSLLIWAGVLAWGPFIYLLANQQAPSIFPFLGAHLAGVLGGAALRASADRMEGVTRTKHGQIRRTVGIVMIYLGVLAWAPYFYLSKIVGQPVELGPFLAVHLTGVLGGGAVRASVELDRFFARK